MNININNVVGGVSSETITNCQYQVCQAKETAAICGFEKMQPPLLRTNSDVIYIPRKVLTTLKKYTDKDLLLRIHPDFDTSIELCLLFLDKLSGTYFEYLRDENGDRWKRLNSTLLRTYYSKNPQTYSAVLSALEYPLKTAAIIECDKSYHNGSSRKYRITNTYIKAGITKYQLKTAIAREYHDNENKRKMRNAKSDPICKNLLQFYYQVTMPTEEQLINQAKIIVQRGLPLKNRKYLRFRHKHPNSYFKDTSQISFVEDNLKIYNSITSDGLIIPMPGSQNSGGRVVDSFTLMPSWCRNLVKVNNNKLTEIDYTCLHPNIAMTIYGGDLQYITHSDISELTGRNIAEVKKEHLSFFNQKIWQMKQSFLWDFYLKYQPQMMKNLVEDKIKNGYINTSRRLFKKEVELMTEVIRRLNEIGIYVGYIYDALITEPQNVELVTQVMDEVAICMGIYTSSKKAA